MCVSGVHMPFYDGDEVSTGKIYTISDVDFCGDVKLKEIGANKTRWNRERFVLATDLIKELV